MNPLGTAFAVPAEIFAALKSLPSLARDIAAIAEATRALPAVERATVAMEEHTRALGQLHDDMRDVAEATKVLPPMDGRMANIEAAMPVLIATLSSLEGSVGPLGRLAQRFPGGRRAARAAARADAEPVPEDGAA